MKRDNLKIVHRFKDGLRPMMCTHLKICQRQLEDVREQAYELCISRSRIERPGESLRQEIVDYLQDQGNHAGFSEWAEGERNAAEQ